MMLKWERRTQEFSGMTKTKYRDLLEACVVCLSRHKHSCLGNTLADTRGDGKRHVETIFVVEPD